MKKQLLSILLVLSVIVLGGVIYAYADDVTATPAPSSIVTPPPNIDKNDPLYILLKQKNSTREDLIKQENQIYSDIKAQNNTNRTLQNDIKLEAKSKNVEVIKEIQVQMKDLTTQVKSLMDQKKSMQTELTQAVKNKDEDKTAELKKSISDIAQQIKDKGASVKTLKDSVAKAKDDGKAALNQIKQVSDQIKSLGSQMQDMQLSVSSLRASKDQEWVEFAKAMKAANLVDANTHMDNIVSYKQQIIDKLNGILALKKQVQGLLEGLK